MFGRFDDESLRDILDEESLAGGVKEGMMEECTDGEMEGLDVGKEGAYGALGSFMLGMIGGGVEMSIAK